MAGPELFVITEFHCSKSIEFWLYRKNVQNVVDIRIVSTSLTINFAVFFSSGVGYQCQGDITEWTKCTNIAETPERKPFIVPQEYREKASLFIREFRYHLVWLNNLQHTKKLTPIKVQSRHPDCSDIETSSLMKHNSQCRSQKIVFIWSFILL